MDREESQLIIFVSFCSYGTDVSSRSATRRLLANMVDQSSDKLCLLIVEHLQLNVTNNVYMTRVLDAIMELNTVDVVDIKGTSVLFRVGGLALLTAREPVPLTQERRCC